jgi:hypothetical protein
MIRKMLVIAAAAALPATAFAGVTIADSGIAGAAAPVVAPATCVISGSVTFGTSGISEGGTIDLNKTSTSVTNLSGTGTNCQATPLITNITQKSAKCKDTTMVALPPSAGALAGLLPGFTTTQLPPAAPGVTLPGCATLKSKNYQSNSAWGFLSGINVKGLPVSTTAGIQGALKKGVAYVDNGVPLTLSVSSVTSIAPPGACGSEAGFQLGGTVKKASTHTWALTLCLGGDTGPGTTNAFLGDLLSQVLATHADTTSATNTSQILTATVDPAASVLTIS